MAKTSSVNYEKQDTILVHGIGYGTIKRAWKDDRGEDLYLVELEDSKATPTGEFLARKCELISVKR